jgi:hypothetical protein
MYPIGLSLRGLRTQMKRLSRVDTLVLGCPARLVPVGHDYRFLVFGRKRAEHDHWINFRTRTDPNTPLADPHTNSLR